MILLKGSTYGNKANIKIGGSKSISNRALMLNAVLKADCELINLSFADDTLNLKIALANIQENGLATIDVHHAGTNMRFLTAYMSALPGEWTITGSARMRQRPIKDLVDALRLLGANITYLDKEGYPPLKILGKKLQSSACEVNANVSSQFISAILLMSPLLENGLQLKLNGKLVSTPYILMTTAMMKDFGFTVSQHHNLISVGPSHKQQINLQPINYFVESDWSSASYWYSICALSKQGKIQLLNFTQNSLQADACMVQIMATLGVKTTFNNQIVVLEKTTHTKNVIEQNCLDCPDIAQTLAVLAVGLGIEAHLSGLSTLSIKETDRIAALKTELEKFGAKVHVDGDSIHIYPQAPKYWQQKSFIIETYHDHRMAMSFAPLALLCESLQFVDEAVVNKSYPAFWEDLKSAGFSVNLLP